MAVLNGPGRAPSTGLAPLGVPLIAPALPVIRDAFGIADAAASLPVSTCFLTGIVLSPFVGMLADRLGRRRALIPSLLVFNLTGGAMAFSPLSSCCASCRGRLRPASSSRR